MYLKPIHDALKESATSLSMAINNLPAGNDNVVNNQIINAVEATNRAIHELISVIESEIPS